MLSFPAPTLNTRLGFHYFPDTLHYRESDLQAWLPELKALGASWISLMAPAERAVPEYFIRGLLEAGIEPVLHFHLPLDYPIRGESLGLLLKTYARWGAHYVCLFDRPNTRAAWSSISWAQSDLVERFLDIFLPWAESALKHNLVPVFPPLEPGGDYWDTAFLRTALRAIKRRGHTTLTDHLCLGAYAWSGNRSLNWGAGGPQRWTAARPYFTPAGSQDQLGFRIFDWYQALAEAELGHTCPLLLLGAGYLLNDSAESGSMGASAITHAHRNLAIARLMLEEPVFPSSPEADANLSATAQVEVLEPVPPEVLACNFWLLSAALQSSFAAQAWIKSDGSKLPVVNALRQLIAARTIERPASFQSPPLPGSGPTNRPISHYLLLPLYAWGVAEWDLDAIRPYLQKYHPTVGFSLTEAALADHVTVLGGEQIFPESALEALRSSGCEVERIKGDGTLFAS